ncbi:hypothetical protein ACWDSD_32560 [Streptomyces spiralis]
MRTASDTGLVPFITQREGEEAAPDNLIILSSPSGQLRLYYADEDPRDRDLHGVLMARCGFSMDRRKMPTGRPRWKMMHPHRQMLTMQAMRCQICADPARTPLGFVFLAGPGAIDPEHAPVLTNQPPVCAQHARAAALLCPHLAGDPMVFIARSAPLYGVHGTLYGYGESGVQVVAQPDEPLPYGHPNLPTFLASQIIRRLGSFRVTGIDDLMRELKHAA